jgi:hypothetical protein
MFHEPPLSSISFASISVHHQSFSRRQTPSFFHPFASFIHTTVILYKQISNSLAYHAPLATNFASSFNWFYNNNRNFSSHFKDPELKLGIYPQTTQTSQNGPNQEHRCCRRFRP